MLYFLICVGGDGLARDGYSDIALCLSSLPCYDEWQNALTNKRVYSRKVEKLNHGACLPVDLECI
jgi:hypothetical protein